MNCHQKAKKISIAGNGVSIDWRHCAVSGLKFDVALTSLPLVIAEQSAKGCLADEALLQAEEMTDSVERSHFIGRRLFQDWFAAEIAETSPFQPGSRAARATNGAPNLPKHPNWALSFSATPNWAAAAACQNAIIGIDIEELRPIENAAALAQRFFSRNEADRLQALPQPSQSEMFLRLWSAKEACLKAVGRGMVYGPERVQINLDNSNGYSVEVPEDLGPSESWQLLSPDFGAALIVSIAIRPR